MDARGGRAPAPDALAAAAITGIPAAEIIRNWLSTTAVAMDHITIDGVTAVAPDLDAELAALLDQEGAL